MSVYIARDQAGEAKSPFWQYDFQCNRARFSGSFDGQDGRPEIRIDRPKREAERAEKVLRAASTRSVTDRPRLTLHDAAARYWTLKAQHEANSDSIWGFIAHLERIIGKHKFLDEIDDEVCAGYVAQRRTEKARRRNNLVSNSTVNRDVETLAEIFKINRKVARLPKEIPEWGNHKLPEKKRVRALSLDEDDALFAAIDELRPDFHDVWEFKLLAGKRLSEVLFMEKAKIDRRARTARVIAKGGREVVIALTDEMMVLIERNWMHHPTRLWTYICQANFTGKNGAIRRKGRRYPFTQDGWREAWKAILEHAKIEDFRPHDLRHTTATRIYAATGDQRAVQDALDHADIRSSGRYTHTYTDQRRQSLEAAAALRRSPGQKSQNRKSAKADS